MINIAGDLAGGGRNLQANLLAEKVDRIGAEVALGAMHLRYPHQLGAVLSQGLLTRGGWVDRRARGWRPAGPAGGCPHPGWRSSVAIRCPALVENYLSGPQDAGLMLTGRPAAWAQFFEHGQLLAEVVEVNGHSADAVLLGQLLTGWRK